MESFAYTPKVLAAEMGVISATVYRLMRFRGLPVFLLGNCVRIPAKAFEKWLEDQMETN